VSFFQRPPCSLKVLILQCHVGIVPVHPGAQHLELGCHVVLLAERELLAPLDELVYAVGLDIPLAAKAKGLLNLDLDWKAMHIPAGSVLDLEAVHGLVAQNSVFDHLVPGGAEVDPACGVGRSVDEEELLSTDSVLSHLSIGLCLFPHLSDPILQIFRIVLSSHLGDQLQFLRKTIFHL